MSIQLVLGSLRKDQILMLRSRAHGNYLSRARVASRASVQPQAGQLPLELRSAIRARSVDPKND